MQVLRAYQLMAKLEQDDVQPLTEDEWERMEPGLREFISWCLEDWGMAAFDPRQDAATRQRFGACLDELLDALHSWLERGQS
jgi:hypothetical protein